MYIRSKSIQSAWLRILSSLHYSDLFESERGQTKELLNLMVKITDPENDMICEHFPMGETELEDYSKQLLNPDKQGFFYTYGERLRNNGKEGVDQIDYVVKCLKENPNSRRAIAVTWIPPVDTKTDEVPCMILVDFKVRNKKLHLTAVFRSNDMFGAWPANAYGLTRLGEHVAQELGIKFGTLTTLSISAHIYEHDFNNVKSVLGVDE